ncbi:MAG: hypothetical protein ACR2NP_12540 [Pirellulaceae bacterium]
MKCPRIIVRKDRKRLATALRSFISSEMTFSDLCKVFAEAHSSRDQTVVFVVEQIGEDWEDVLVQPEMLDKSEWDYLQRLLLLLDSSHHVVRENRWHWCYTQLVALASLGVVVWLLFAFGWQWLLLATVPATLVSLYLFRIRSRKVTRPWQNVLTPFGTFDQLRSTWDSVPTFRKQRYPKRRSCPVVSLSGLLGPIGLVFVSGWFVALLAITPPVSLLVQMFPIFEERVDVAGSSR